MKKYIEKPIFLACTAAIIYLSGFIFLMADTLSEPEFFDMRICRGILQFLPYLNAIIYCIGYNQEHGSNPRSSVFVILLSQISMSIVCIFSGVRAHTYGLYSVFSRIHVNGDLFDIAVICTQILLVILTPYIKRKVITDYARIMCGIYSIAVVLRIIFFFTDNLAIHPDTILFLTAEIALHYVLLWFAREFCVKNIGGGWDCLIEHNYDEDDEKDYEYFDDEDVYFDEESLNEYFDKYFK